MVRIGYWGIVAASTSWACVSLIFSSDGTLDWDEQGLLLITGLVLAVAWLVMPRWSDKVKKGIHGLIWFALPVFCSVAMLVASQTHLSLAARLWLSEGAMRGHAETSEPTPTFGKPECLVGLFTVGRVRKEGQTVLLQTCQDGFNEVGVVYSSNGRPSYTPRSEVKVSYTHLFGPWYRYEFPNKGGS